MSSEQGDFEERLLWIERIPLDERLYIYEPILTTWQERRLREVGE